MYLVIYGPEGSGKGTQAKLLADKIGLSILTAGDLVREAARKDKSLLREMARQVLKKGTYLPDRQMCSLIVSKLKNPKQTKGFVLDGFPRTIGQAKFLMEIFSQEGYKLHKVIYLCLSQSESIKRLLKRKRKLFDESRILHDDPQRIKQRLSIYHKKEKALLKFFREKNLLLEINGNQSVEKVFADILEGLKIRENKLS